LVDRRRDRPDLNGDAGRRAHAKAEVAANDTPYMQKSNIPAGVSVHRLALTLPLYSKPSE
jgi:hypothetical protein